MIKQRMMNPQKAGGSVIASIFDNDKTQQQVAPPQQTPSQNFQAPPATGNSFDDGQDIPF